MGVPGIRSFGLLWCPSCAMKMEFISEDPRCASASDAECFACGHVYGRRRIETMRKDGSGYDIREEEVIPSAVAMESQERERKYHDVVLFSSGVSLGAIRRRYDRK